ncbi:MAG: hypothetical protein HZA15_01210 [Nitrospirae bacterium]|nr:hypothetical protein [Nitrospirota bacterium]
MVPGKKASEKYYVLLIASVFMLCLCSLVFAGTVVIKPGQFDHFTLQMPDKAMAGENFVVKVSAYDASKNLITNFSETGKEFRVDVSGSATAQPSVMGASLFSGGLASIVINDKKAEKITLSIIEAGGSVPVITRELMVVPNRLDHFVLQSPVSVTAGTSFDVKVVAKDIFENTVQDYDIGKNIKLMTTGTSSVRMHSGEAIDFKNGLASAVLVSEKVGDLVIELQDTASGSRGKTQNIQINPSSLAYFKLQAPKAAVAGEPFELLLSAYDMHDNVVTNYASTGSGIRLSATGTTKVEPSTINPSEFKNGQALVKVAYEKAEEIQIVARELNREQSGRTSDIFVTNAIPDHFIVVTPDTAVSGQKFRIRVEAYDRFNNIARNFNLTGFDVMLGTSGNGSLSPSKIAPPDFTNGIAVAEVMYDRAESFQISARMASDRSAGKISVSAQEIKREVSRAPAAADKKEFKKPDETALKTATEKKMKDPEKVKQKKEVRTEKRNLSKPEPKKQEVRPAKEVKKPESKKETALKTEVKKEEPKKEASKKESPKAADRETGKKPIEPQQHIAKKELPPVKPVEKKIEKLPADEPKKPVMELARKEEKKSDKSQYNISKVSIIEAKSKAMLVINITNPNGNLDYGDEIESKFGREWLKLKVKPAINSTEKAFKFKSAYIGEVLIEEDKTSGQNLVNIYIELLPSGITYDIARIKNTLVVTFANP